MYEVFTLVFHPLNEGQRKFNLKSKFKFWYIHRSIRCKILLLSADLGILTALTFVG